MQSTTALRKIFTLILIIYGVNLIGRLITMDKQFLDGTLNTSVSADATITFLVYSGLSVVVALLTLIVGWPFKWLRYLLILIFILLGAAIFAPIEWLNLLPFTLPKLTNLEQSIIQAINAL